MSFTENPSEIVIGGSIDSLLVMNVNRGAITNKVKFCWLIFNIIEIHIFILEIILTTTIKKKNLLV